MNKVFKVIWNHTAQTWVAVSELSPVKGKSKSVSAAALVAGVLLSGGVQAALVTTPLTTNGETKQHNDDGISVVTTDKNTTLIGENATVFNKSSTNNNNTYGNLNLVIGKDASVTGNDSIAIGYQSNANVTRFSGGVAVGAGAVATGANGHLDRKNPVSGLGEGKSYTHPIAGTVGAADSGNGQFVMDLDGDGKRSNADSTAPTAVGHKAYAEKGGSAFGSYAVARSLAVAAGSLAVADDIGAVAMGVDSFAKGNSAVSIGRNSATKGDFAISIGNVAAAQDNGSIAMGHSAYANGYRSIAIGTTDIYAAPATVSTVSSGTGKVQFGSAYSDKNQTLAEGIDATSLGASATAKGNHATSLGAFAKSENESASAIGYFAAAEGSRATAIGSGSHAAGESAVALANNARALSNQSVAVGVDSLSLSDGSVAIGVNAISGASSISDTLKQQITEKKAAVKTAETNLTDAQKNLQKQIVAQPFDKDKYAEAQKAYVDALAALQTATNDLEAVVKTAKSANADTQNAVAIGANAIAADKNALAVGVDSYVGSAASGAFGYKNKVSDGAENVYIVGSNNTAADTADNTFILGSGVTAANANGVILGNGSADAKLVKTENATVGGVTYSGFAGVSDAANGVVSIGAAGKERQIKHVAAGQINANSTDAINGSQLYAVVDKLSPAPKFSLNSTGKLDDIGNEEEDGGKFVNATTVHEAISQAGWQITSDVDGGKRAEKGDKRSTEIIRAGDEVVLKAGKNLTIKQNGAEFTYATDNEVEFDSIKVPTNSANNPITITAGGIQAGGKKITHVAAGDVNENSTDAVNGSQLYELKKNLSNLNTTVGGGLKFSGDDENVTFTKKLGETVTVRGELKDGEVASAGNIRVDVEGDELVVKMAEKPKFKGLTLLSDKEDDDSEVSFDVTDGVLNLSTINASSPQVTVSNVKDNLPITYNKDELNPNNKPVTTSQKLPEGIKDKANNAATVGDVLNAGWNLQGNGKAVDFVKAYDTVNFVNGAGTTVEAKASADGKTSIIKINTLTSLVDKDGNPVVAVTDPATGNVSYYTQKNVDDSGKPKPNAQAIDTQNNPLHVNIVNPVAEAGKQTSTPTQLGNIESGLKPYTKAEAEAKKTPKAEGLVNLDNQAVPDNTVVTAGDLRNMGWVVAAGDDYSAQVKNANEVKFVGTGAAKVSGNDAGNTRVITIHVDEQVTANNVISLAKGAVMAKPDGTIGVDDKQKGELVSKESLVKAVNESGWKVGIGRDDTDFKDGAGKDGKHLVKPSHSVVFNSGSNLKIKQTVTEKETQITYALNDSIKVKEIKVGDGDKNNVSITEAGIDAGNKTITNVAAGKNDTDAVNYGQLKAAMTGNVNNVNQINQRLDNMDKNMRAIDKDLRAGVAGATAMAQLPQVTLPGASVLAAGVGHYKGQNAFAVGVSHLSDGGNWIVKAQASANTQGDFNIGAGIGYQWR